MAYEVAYKFEILYVGVWIGITVQSSEVNSSVIHNQFIKMWS